MSYQDAKRFFQQHNDNQHFNHSKEADAMLKDINIMNIFLPIAGEILILFGIGGGTIILKKMGVPGDVIKMIIKMICFSQ